MSAAGSTLGSVSPLDARGAAETPRPAAIGKAPLIPFMAGQRAPNRGPQFVHALLYLCDALHLDVQVPMDVVDLSFDNFEHVASLDRRPRRTRLPLWTTRTPVPAVTSIPGWSFRPARTPVAARTTFALCHGPAAKQ